MLPRQHAQLPNLVLCGNSAGRYQGCARDKLGRNWLKLAVRQQSPPLPGCIAEVGDRYDIWKTGRAWHIAFCLPRRIRAKEAERILRSGLDWRIAGHPMDADVIDRLPAGVAHRDRDRRGQSRYTCDLVVASVSVARHEPSHAQVDLGCLASAAILGLALELFLLQSGLLLKDADFT
jgi:hypothetical protein